MMAGQVPAVVIADELPLVRDGIACLCERNRGYRVVATVPDGDAAWAAIQLERPLLALVNLAVAGLHALELPRRVRAARLPTRVVLLSARRDRKTVLEALRAGVQGVFLLSGTSVALLDCLDRVASGGIYVSPELNAQDLFTPDRPGAEPDPLRRLSAREFQVFSLLVDGVRPKEIAARLELSAKTVDTYRASLMRKLEIHDVPGLVKFAIQHGLLSS